MDQETVAPEATPAVLPPSTNELPPDILAHETEALKNYQETDVFAWANNLVQFKDELKIDIFLVNKNYVVYKTNMARGTRQTTRTDLYRRNVGVRPGRRRRRLDRAQL